MVSRVVVSVVVVAKKVVHLNPVIFDENGSWSWLRGGGKRVISCESNFDFFETEGERVKE